MGYFNVAHEWFLLNTLWKSAKIKIYFFNKTLPKRNIEPFNSNKNFLFWYCASTTATFLFTVLSSFQTCFNKSFISNMASFSLSVKVIFEVLERGFSLSLLPVSSFFFILFLRYCNSPITIWTCERPVEVSSSWNSFIKVAYALLWFFCLFEKRTAARSCIHYNNLISAPLLFVTEKLMWPLLSAHLSQSRLLCFNFYTICISIQFVFVDLLLSFFFVGLVFSVSSQDDSSLEKFWWSMFAFWIYKSRWSCFLFILINTKQQFICRGLHLKWHSSDLKQTTLTKQLYASIYALQTFGQMSSMMQYCIIVSQLLLRCFFMYLIIYWFILHKRQKMFSFMDIKFRRRLKMRIN